MIGETAQDDGSLSKQGGTMTNKISRRQFLATLAAAAAGALIAGVVKVEPEPVLDVDVVAAGRYLLEDNFDGYGSVNGTLATPGPGVRTVVDWDAGVDVRGAGLTIADGDYVCQYDMDLRSSALIIDDGAISWQGNFHVQFDEPAPVGVRLNAAWENSPKNHTISYEKWTHRGRRAIVATYDDGAIIEHCSQWISWTACWAAVEDNGIWWIEEWEPDTPGIMFGYVSS